jgi:general secretion pathway protein D
MKFQFKDAPIDSVITTVMSQLGYSYIIDPGVQGTVSIFTMREVPHNQLFAVLEQLLKMNGHAIVKQADGVFVILPIGQSPTIPHSVHLLSPESSEQVEGTPEPGQESEAGETHGPPESETQQLEEPQPTEPEEPQVSEETTGPEAEAGPQVSAEQPEGEAEVISSSQGVITYIIPLHYIPSDQMLQMLQPFLSPGATVVDFQPGNMVLITDNRRNIEQALSLVDLLDTRYFTTNRVELIPIRFNQAVDVAEDLAQVFAPDESSAGVRIVAIERLNSILIVTRSGDVFREVIDWIEKLDAPSSTSNIKTFVYQVENSTSVQIAQILAELYQDSDAPPGERGTDQLTGDQGGAFVGRQTGGAYGSGLSRSGASGFGGSSAYGGASRYGGQSSGMYGGSSRYGGSYGQSGYSPGMQGGFDQRGFGTGNLGMRELGPSLGGELRSQIRSIVAGNTKIVVNEFNNSLIIQGTESDIQFILETVKQLDTLPRQVFIEAQVVAVELKDDLTYGVNAYLQARGAGIPVPGDGDDGGTIVDSPSPATTAAMVGGQLAALTRIAIGDSRQLQLLFTALKEVTRVEIIEAPRILAVDGTAASINVGAEVPVTSASFGNTLQSGTTHFVNSIQFRQTGTTLLIIPRISASGIVAMDVVLEVSSATGPALTPTINRSYIQTSLIIRDGQTVGMGGMISDHQDESRSRVPLLGDIPIIGALFGTTTNNDRRFELIVFLTPRVIRTLPTSAELTLEFRRALKNTYDVLNRWEYEQNMMIEDRRRQEDEAATAQEEAQAAAEAAAEQQENPDNPEEQ